MATCPNETKQAGGLGSIAEQTVDHEVDVLMGGGKQRFDQTVTGGPYAGMTVVQQAQALGYGIPTDQTGLASAVAGTKFLGLFAAGNMDLEWTGLLAAPYPGPAPTTCTESNSPRPVTQPHLSDMTAKAIELLSTKVKGDKRHGFFLQSRAHRSTSRTTPRIPAGRSVRPSSSTEPSRSESTGRGRTPRRSSSSPRNHGHTSQIIDPQTASDHSPGAIATLITADGQPMVVNYATNLDGRSQSHTGTEVRIAAQGPQGANVVGVTNQTDLFHTMARALGLE